MQVNLDQTGTSKSKVEKGIFMPGDVDNGDVLATKSGAKITMLAGSRMDGESLPPSFLFDKPIDPQFMRNLPHSSLIDPKTKQHLQATVCVTFSAFLGLEYLYG